MTLKPDHSNQRRSDETGLSRRELLGALGSICLGTASLPALSALAGESQAEPLAGFDQAARQRLHAINSAFQRAPGATPESKARIAAAAVLHGLRTEDFRSQYELAARITGSRESEGNSILAVAAVINRKDVQAFTKAYREAQGSDEARATIAAIAVIENESVRNVRARTVSAMGNAEAKATIAAASIGAGASVADINRKYQEVPGGSEARASIGAASAITGDSTVEYRNAYGTAAGRDESARAIIAVAAVGGGNQKIKSNIFVF